MYIKLNMFLNRNRLEIFLILTSILLMIETDYRQQIKDLTPKEYLPKVIKAISTAEKFHKDQTDFLRTIC